MARATIEPITDATLPEVAALLHENLDRNRPTDDWIAALKTHWGGERPNFGFLLRSDARVVGAICAFYAQRAIGGRIERTCNITSWCVLDEFRNQSMRLAMAVTGQQGWHFTDFSPTAVVGGVLRFLKFKPLDERQAVILNLPLPRPDSRLLRRQRDIEAALERFGTEEQRRAYRDHVAFSWLNHLLVGTGNRWCHVIYKRTAFKGVPAARVIYLSDGETFIRHFGRLATHLLLRAIVSTHVECRFLPRQPWPSAIRSGFNAKLYLSESLRDNDIDYLYSETMALDI